MKRRVTSLASTSVSRLQPRTERAASKASASTRTVSVVLVDAVPFCQPFWLSSGKTKKPSETITLKRAKSTEPDGSAAGQTTVLTLQKFCFLQGVPPSRTVLDALVRADKWVAAVAQLESVRSKQNALEAEQGVSQKRSIAVAIILHGASGSAAA